MITFTVTKDLFTDEFTVTIGNMEATFDTYEQALAFIASEMKAELR